MNKDSIIEKLEQINLELDTVYTDKTGCADCGGCCGCCWETSSQHEKLQGMIRELLEQIKKEN